ncbi:PDR/VanB family oxidoreductase [Candidatus Mycobacterium methanotrophicum]|uniref:PDR/VanB family oxidoreductase n=1 Tax=Candidatus Mycobacterium methanotrophicum TaxID=2943498 RepID=A0ABY4QTU4_9MYCO|nr:PDR/VanB family oxidoreductase [Candidatus Mycobacterium methanotrophicum]UQX13606.1 PDR/VanB family oxidoreductase [Candidatus Mycobacterium methanotrophicum]
MTTCLALIVADIQQPVPGIRSLQLCAPDGRALPPFIPGSHLTLDCGGKRNAYSLTNDGLDPREYCVSVLRVRDGRGGSRWVHEQLAVGDMVNILAPRSAFAPHPRASKHLLIAGGIGITPIVSHLRSARRWNHRVQVLYGHREGFGAHVDDVLALAGFDAELYVDQDELCVRVAKVLADQPVGTHLYVCGPGAMIDYVLDTAAEAGWPPSRLHLERFGANALDPGERFEVALTKSACTLDVPSGISLLEALERAGLDVPNLCRQGVCGECRIPVSGGVPLHRDLFLDDETKQRGDTMMCCVSRAAGPSLEVPL